MPDGPTAVSKTAVPTVAGPPVAGSATASYAQIYEEQQPQLVAYARSLTGNPWLADDLVAEAHFRVWRRLSAGHSIDNVPAYLTTTVRNLAATVGRSTRESPQDPQDDQGPWGAEPVAATGDDHDPGTRIASVDLLTRVLGQLPERWVKALWLAEAEDQPLEAVARGVGAGRGATAVLLHRAREGMRQAFLRAHPGTPMDPACDAYWERIPAHVRGADSERQSDKLQRHLDDCADCRDRLAVLMQANTRLPALVGPALLIFVLGGAAKFLVPAAGGAAVASASAASGSGSASAAAGGHGSGPLHAVRHVLTGGSKVPATVLGAVAVSVAGAVVAAGLTLGGSDAPVPQQRTATVESAVPAPAPTPPPRAEPPATRPEPVPATEDAPRAPERRDERAPLSVPAQQAPPQAPDEPDRAASQPEAPVPVPEPVRTEAEATAPARTEEPTTEPTPVQPTPVQPTPVEPTPVEPTPVEPTPVEPTPVEPTPVEPTPVEPTPTPVEPTPVEPEPVEPTPPPEPVCKPWLGPVWLCRLP